MSLWSPDAWLEAWHFAARAHQGQTVPGSELPYVIHLGMVAMEVSHAVAQRAGPPAKPDDGVAKPADAVAKPADAVARPDLAVTVALLHDVVEDTQTELSELVERFGQAVADGVSALSKNPAVGDKPAQMRDSLQRIRAQPKEIWMVKLADRVTNLQPPPHFWKADKIRRYRDEAREIHATLGSACPVLGPRLLAKIDAYGEHLEPA